MQDGLVITLLCRPRLVVLIEYSFMLTARRILEEWSEVASCTKYFVDNIQIYYVCTGN